MLKGEKKSKLRNYSFSLALLKLFLGKKKQGVSLFLFAKHANGFPSVSAVKIPPAKQEMQYPCVGSLHQEDPL